MIKKHISLSEEDIKLLNQYKEQHGFHTDSQVFSCLLKEAQNDKKQLAVLIREELEKSYIQKDRIKWATQTAEQNSIILMDVANTLLWLLNVKENLSVENAPHPVITQSRHALKKKIAYFKQKSDERKAKSGMEKTQDVMM